VVLWYIAYVNGSKTKITECWLLKINIQGIEYEINVHLNVLKDIIFKILLGNDFCLKHGIIIDFRKK